MKKITALCVFGCVLAVSAFSQFGMGGFGKSHWIPYRLTIDEEGEASHTTAVQVPWGGPDINAGLFAIGSSEWGGIHLSLAVARGHEITAEGSGWVWARLFNFIPYMDTFTIYLGDPNDSTLAGKVESSSLVAYVLDASPWKNDFRLEYREAQYNTFTRINPYAWGNALDKFGKNLSWPKIMAASMITWEPVDNLFIGAFIAPEQFILRQWNTPFVSNNGPPHNSAGTDEISNDFYDAQEVYKNIQICAGYDFPDIGFARLQYLGIRSVVEAAFRLNSLAGLVLDIGLKIPFEHTYMTGSTTYRITRDYQVSLAATYRNYDFGFTGRLDTAFAGSDSSDSANVKTRGLDLIAYLVPSYQFPFGTIGMDIGFEYEQKDDINNYPEDGMQAGMAIWLQRSIGGAAMKIAAVSRFPLSRFGEKQNFEMFLPIFLEVGF